MAQVDIIIPVYNTPIAYVEEALASVLAQTFHDYVAIVVNDGSNAETTAALEALVQRLHDPRIRYVKSENRGLPAARNLGISSSDSPFIALLDSDDAWYPDKLARQMKMLAQNPHADVIHCCTDYLYGSDHSGLKKMQPALNGSNDLSVSEGTSRMLRGNFVGVNTVIFRRAAAERVGFFDEQCKTLEDKDLWTRMLIDGSRFLQIPEVLAIYRIHGSNLSKNAEKMRAGRLRIISKMDALVGKGHGWLDRDWPQLRREMLHHAYHEVAETYVESGQYGKAFVNAMPWHAGMSVRSLRLAAVSALGMVGVKRTKATA